jgi:2-aminoethylphosphonate-pyruvate transaminase
MLMDMGSRDDAFIRLISEIRSAILRVAGVCREDGFETIPIQGSGTYGIEAVLATVIGPNDRLLILVNGAYGRRMAEMAKCLGLQHEVYEVNENAVHDRATLELLFSRTRFTHLAAVHCETTTGILNPVDLWSTVAEAHRCQFIVDAMSSFGGIPLNMSSVPIDYLISSSNKCLQGVPGVAFVVARRESLMAGQHEPRSLSLNLRQQLLGFENNGQFRFTPPTHVLLALHQALMELDAEGGVGRRAARYKENHQVLCAGMQALGFCEYLPTPLQSHIITAFLYPNKNFVFDDFYRRLSDHGMLIYPGKLSKIDCFRIGNIGHLFPDDIRALLRAIKEVMSAMELMHLSSP